MAHILVVDDQECMRDIICHMLKDRGHDLEVAGDGEEGLAIFNAAPHSFNLIVADVNMPKLDGFEFLKIIKSTDPKIPVILMTGMNEEVVGVIGQEYHADAVIKKPFIVEQALDIIEGFSKIAAN